MHAIRMKMACKQQLTMCPCMHRRSLSPHVVLGRLKHQRAPDGAASSSRSRRESGSAAFSPSYSLQRSRTLARTPSAKHSHVAARTGPGLFTEHIAWERAPTGQRGRARGSVIVTGAKEEQEGTPGSLTYPIASWTEPSAPGPARGA